VPVDDIAEAIQFLEWVAADNFTLLGVRDYTLAGKERDLKPMLETGLGVLRGGDVPVLTRGGQVVSITPQLRAFFDEPKTLIVTKANAKSRVHRRVYLDYIGVKRFDADGNPSGEFRIVGLFTSTAHPSIRSILFAPRSMVLMRAGFNRRRPGKALVNAGDGLATSCSRRRDTPLSLRRASCNRRTSRYACWPRPLRPFSFVLVYVPRERNSGRSADRVSRRGVRRPRQRLLPLYPRCAVTA
jgi:glutamate dehydrogenase